jgi:hypothetical protein
MWKDCLNVAYSIPLPAEEIEQLAFNLADKLVERRQFRDAARLYLDYGKDETAMEKAVNALAKSYEFTEAIRVVRTCCSIDNIRSIKNMDMKKLSSLFTQQLWIPFRRHQNLYRNSRRS